MRNMCPVICEGVCQDCFAKVGWGYMCGAMSRSRFGLGSVYLTWLTEIWSAILKMLHTCMTIAVVLSPRSTKMELYSSSGSMEGGRYHWRVDGRWLG